MPSAPSSGSTAAAKLAAVTSVSEPKDINYKVTPTMWNYDNGAINQKFDFSGQVTALRLELNTQQASTVEIDLEDADFQVLSDPLFCHWAFNIEDVSVDSTRKFKTTKLSNSTDTAYLGDEADLEWVLGQRPIDFEIGDVFYRLCSLQSQQTNLTLTFEDRVASMLRDQSGALSWDRSQHTRAQFVAMLCRKAGVDYFIPELNVAQPVEIDTSTTGNSTTTQVTGHTISSAANLTVKGHAITKAQLSVANQICQLGEKLGAPSDAIVALLFDCIYESEMGLALSNPTSNYGGVLGGSKSIFSPDLSSAQAMITAAYKGGQGFTSAISLAKQKPGNIAWIGSQCTRPTPFDSSGISTQYESQSTPGGIQGTVSEATSIYAAYGGPRLTGSTTSATTSTGSYAFTRGPNEDSWDCIQRLASEVAWYAFARQNRLWFVSGNYLFQQQSQLSAQIGQDGVAWIDVDLDMGARDQTAECDIYARTDLWAALPGMVVSIVNRGPATGKWFVSQIQATPLDPTQNAQITVYKPVPKRAEPAANSSNSSTTTPAGVIANGSSSVLAAYNAAQALANKSTIYSKAARTLVPLSKVPQGANMFDCSGSVSEVLYLAGFKLPGGATTGSWAPVSGAFAAGVAGLQSGPGQMMTIWTNAEHIFLEFNLPGIGHFQGNTVSPTAGFDLYSWNTATAGWGGPTPGAGGAPQFTPLHYPGT